MPESIASMPTYDAYKDSGVEWLGDIPKHWEITRLGTRFQERKEKVSDKDFSPLSVTKNGVLPQLSTAAKTNDGDNRKLVLEGDFVINSRSDRKGSSGIADRDGSVSLINIVLEPYDVEPTFCHCLLKSYAFIEEFYRIGHGIVADLWTTRYDEMKTVIIGIPPLPEQTAIADFLGKKTSLIDEAVSVKEQQITLLKERKQILIQNAVTRGLNADAPMRDSGVEWIGEIPKYWEIKRLKRCSRISSGNAIVNNELLDNGKYEVFGGNGFMGYTEKHNVDGVHIIIGRVGAQCGNIRLIRKRKWISDNALILTLNKKENYAFFSYLLYAANLNTMNTSNAQPLITGTKVMNCSIPIPPLNEQSAIAAHIETESAKVDKAIELQKQQIEKLKEYKVTLINSAVTGKIRVMEEPYAGEVS